MLQSIKLRQKSFISKQYFDFSQKNKEKSFVYKKQSIYLLRNKTLCVLKR